MIANKMEVMKIITLPICVGILTLLSLSFATAQTFSFSTGFDSTADLTAFNFFNQNAVLGVDPDVGVEGESGAIFTAVAPTGTVEDQRVLLTLPQTFDGATTIAASTSVLFSGADLLTSAVEGEESKSKLKLQLGFALGTTIPQKDDKGTLKDEPQKLFETNGGVMAEVELKYEQKYKDGIFDKQKLEIKMKGTTFDSGVKTENFFAGGEKEAKSGLELKGKDGDSYLPAEDLALLSGFSLDNFYELRLDLVFRENILVAENDVPVFDLTFGLFDRGVSGVAEPEQVFTLSGDPFFGTSDNLTLFGIPGLNGVALTEFTSDPTIHHAWLIEGEKGQLATELYFDNLEFSFTSIPEPGTAWLVGMGILVLTSRRRVRGREW